MGTGDLRSFEMVLENLTGSLKNSLHLLIIQSKYFMLSSVKEKC